jgi:hypothetical protein
MVLSFQSIEVHHRADPPGQAARAARNLEWEDAYAQ